MIRNRSLPSRSAISVSSRPFFLWFADRRQRFQRLRHRPPTLTLTHECGGSLIEGQGIGSKAAGIADRGNSEEPNHRDTEGTEKKNEAAFLCAHRVSVVKTHSFCPPSTTGPLPDGEARGARHADRSHRRVLRHSAGAGRPCGPAPFPGARSASKEIREEPLLALRAPSTEGLNRKRRPPVEPMTRSGDRAITRAAGERLLRNRRRRQEGIDDGHAVIALAVAQVFAVDRGTAELSGRGDDRRIPV